MIFVDNKGEIMNLFTKFFKKRTGIVNKQLLDNVRSFILSCMNIENETTHVSNNQIIKYSKHSIQNDSLEKNATYSNIKNDLLNIQKMTKNFNQILFDFIDQKGFKTDAHFYKHCNIDRRHFSKIRSNPYYLPRRSTIFIFVLALNLTMEEAEKLLSSAGYTFSNTSRTDIIVRYCIKNRIYDFYDVDDILKHFEQPSLQG